ncbi:Heat shock 70 protein 14 [Carex littledalei]|uniref:Heat shock 70 protein 14 n=1 Tax=Carex littledalei TaxID=544730 RepID=A0A833VC57_9POAL|nr:Heat shock 70 protein 14 [Carex littledalei]
MSVVGFDVGNDTCTVAVARQRGIDVILNDESKRETPAVVSFMEKQRYVGAASSTNELFRDAQKYYRHIELFHVINAL